MNSSASPNLMSPSLVTQSGPGSASLLSPEPQESVSSNHSELGDSATSCTNTTTATTNSNRHDTAPATAQRKVFKTEYKSKFTPFDQYVYNEVTDSFVKQQQQQVGQPISGSKSNQDLALAASAASIANEAVHHQAAGLSSGVAHAVDTFEPCNGAEGEGQPTNREPWYKEVQRRNEKANEYRFKSEVGHNSPLINYLRADSPYQASQSECASTLMSPRGNESIMGSADYLTNKTTAEGGFSSSRSQYSEQNTELGSQDPRQQYRFTPHDYKRDHLIAHLANNNNFALPKEQTQESGGAGGVSAGSKSASRRPNLVTATSLRPIGRTGAQVRSRSQSARRQQPTTPSPVTYTSAAARQRATTLSTKSAKNVTPAASTRAAPKESPIKRTPLSTPTARVASSSAKPSSNGLTQRATPTTTTSLTKKSATSNTPSNTPTAATRTMPVTTRTTPRPAARTTPSLKGSSTTPAHTAPKPISRTSAATTTATSRAGATGANNQAAASSRVTPRSSVGALSSGRTSASGAKSKTGQKAATPSTTSSATTTVKSIKTPKAIAAAKEAGIAAAAAAAAAATTAAVVGTTSGSTEPDAAATYLAPDKEQSKSQVLDTADDAPATLAADQQPPQEQAIGTLEANQERIEGNKTDEPSGVTAEIPTSTAEPSSPALGLGAAPVLDSPKTAVMQPTLLYLPDEQNLIFTTTEGGNMLADELAQAEKAAHEASVQSQHVREPVDPSVEQPSIPLKQAVESEIEQPHLGELEDLNQATTKLVEQPEERDKSDSVPIVEPIENQIVEQLSDLLEQAADDTEIKQPQVECEESRQEATNFVEQQEIPKLELTEDHFEQQAAESKDEGLQENPDDFKAKTTEFSDQLEESTTKLADRLEQTATDLDDQLEEVTTNLDDQLEEATTKLVNQLEETDDESDSSPLQPNLNRVEKQSSDPLRLAVESNIKESHQKIDDLEEMTRKITDQLEEMDESAPVSPEPTVDRFVEQSSTLLKQPLDSDIDESHVEFGDMKQVTTNITEHEDRNESIPLESTVNQLMKQSSDLLLQAAEELRDEAEDLEERSTNLPDRLKETVETLLEPTVNQSVEQSLDPFKHVTGSEFELSPEEPEPDLKQTGANLAEQQQGEVDRNDDDGTAILKPTVDRFMEQASDLLDQGIDESQENLDYLTQTMTGLIGQRQQEEKDKDIDSAPLEANEEQEKQQQQVEEPETLATKESVNFNYERQASGEESDTSEDKQHQEAVDSKGISCDKSSLGGEDTSDLVNGLAGGLISAEDRFDSSEREMYSDSNAANQRQASDASPYVNQNYDDEPYSIMPTVNEQIRADGFVVELPEMDGSKYEERSEDDLVDRINEAAPASDAPPSGGGGETVDRVKTENEMKRTAKEEPLIGFDDSEPEQVVGESEKKLSEIEKLREDHSNLESKWRLAGISDENDNDSPSSSSDDESPGKVVNFENRTGQHSKSKRAASVASGYLRGRLDCSKLAAQASGRPQIGLKEEFGRSLTRWLRETGNKATGPVIVRAGSIPAVVGCAAHNGRSSGSASKRSSLREAYAVINSKLSAACTGSVPALSPEPARLQPAALRRARMRAAGHAASGSVAEAPAGWLPSLGSSLRRTLSLRPPEASKSRRQEKQQQVDTSSAGSPLSRHREGAPSALERRSPSPSRAAPIAGRASLAAATTNKRFRLKKYNSWINSVNKKSLSTALFVAINLLLLSELAPRVHMAPIWLADRELAGLSEPRGNGLVMQQKQQQEPPDSAEGDAEFGQVLLEPLDELERRQGFSGEPLLRELFRALDSDEDSNEEENNSDLEIQGRLKRRWIERRRLERDRSLEPPPWLRAQPMRRGSIAASGEPKSEEEGSSSLPPSSMMDPDATQRSQDDSEDKLPPDGASSRGRKSRQTVDHVYEEILLPLLEEAYTNRALLDELSDELELRLRPQSQRLQQSQGSQNVQQQQQQQKQKPQLEKPMQARQQAKQTLLQQQQASDLAQLSNPQPRLRLMRLGAAQDQQQLLAQGQSQDGEMGAQVDGHVAAGGQSLPEQDGSTLVVVGDEVSGGTDEATPLEGETETLSSRPTAAMMSAAYTQIGPGAGYEATASGEGAEQGDEAGHGRQQAEQGSAGGLYLVPLEGGFEAATEPGEQQRKQQQQQQIELRGPLLVAPPLFDSFHVVEDIDQTTDDDASLQSVPPSAEGDSQGRQQQQLEQTDLLSGPTSSLEAKRRRSSGQLVAMMKRGQEQAWLRLQGLNRPRLGERTLSLIEAPRLGRAQLIQAVIKVKDQLEQRLGLAPNTILGLYPMEGEKFLIKLDASQLSAYDITNLIQNYDYARGYITVTWPRGANQNPMALLVNILRTLAPKYPRGPADNLESPESDLGGPDGNEQPMMLESTSSGQYWPPTAAALRARQLAATGWQVNEDGVAAGLGVAPSFTFSGSSEKAPSKQDDDEDDEHRQQRPAYERDNGLLSHYLLDYNSPAAANWPGSNGDQVDLSAERSSYPGARLSLPLLAAYLGALYSEPGDPPLAAYLPLTTGAKLKQAPAPAAGPVALERYRSQIGARDGPDSDRLGKLLLGSHWVEILAMLAAILGALAAVKLVARKSGAQILRRRGPGSGRDPELGSAGQRPFGSSLRSIWLRNTTGRQSVDSVESAEGSLISGHLSGGEKPAKDLGGTSAHNLAAYLADDKSEGKPAEGTTVGGEFCEKNSVDLLMNKLANLLNRAGPARPKTGGEPIRPEVDSLDESPLDEGRLAVEGAGEEGKEQPFRSSRSYIKSLIEALSKARSQLPLAMSRSSDGLANSASDGAEQVALLAAEETGEAETEAEAEAERQQDAGILMSQMDISAAHLILAYMEKHLEDKDRLQREWRELQLCAAGGNHEQAAGGKRATASTAQARSQAANSKMGQLLLQQLAKVALSEENKHKNRTSLVVPYDRNRVKLSSYCNKPGAQVAAATASTASPVAGAQLKGSRKASGARPPAQPGCAGANGKSDYINASYIYDDDPRRPTHIIAQGPSEHTVGQFWQMVWESGVSVVVMLTRLNENSVPMCHCYWPTTAATKGSPPSSSSSSVEQATSISSNTDANGGAQKQASGSEPASQTSASGNSLPASSANGLQAAHNGRRGSVTSVFNTAGARLNGSGQPIVANGDLSNNVLTFEVYHNLSLDEEPADEILGADEELQAGGSTSKSHQSPGKPVSASSTSSKAQRSNRSVAGSVPASTQFEVHLVSEHVSSSDYLVRNMYMINRTTGETRTITQFHYLAWPEAGVPENVKSLLQFRRKVHKSYRNLKSPILVHCSDGAGRSGTYVLIDIILERIKNGAKEIDLKATLEHLRDQRHGLCATQSQFEFVLMALAEEIQIILNALPQ